MSDDKKTLPIDFDSDYSLPGRYEESNAIHFEETRIPKQKSKGIWIMIIGLVIVSSVFFSYYFLNQNEIDSNIIQNAIVLDPEEILVEKFNVGEYGSDHAHAAILLVIDGEQLNFGLPQFQLTSKYIHFENNNPVTIHKHATNVPLEMLFASIGITISDDCVTIEDYGTRGTIRDICTRQGEELVVFVNRKKYDSDISGYEIKHNDRILIAIGHNESIPKYLAYLDAFKIPDVPKKKPDFSEKDVLI
ncbi:hypothetical protein NsoK4_06405 [Nitrosopumilus sp. K4]|uniref:hypothetical protein n=1 Tax=Nitrosopumilus sp. K4 TaxID=2795383 RepID=UPI001BA9042F|nr:hypothetical protein [Nitrosopumilus sp. K4]QUC64078.1 hypothetical protein NsoK4_06405 [Nitrosopumilus sp. K4]